MSRLTRHNDIKNPAVKIPLLWRSGAAGAKVALLAINAKYVHSSLAAWVLAGGVSAYSRLPHDVNVIEATIHQTVGEIAAKVAALAPDVVGVSAYIWNANLLPELLGTLSELLPGTTIVLGGPEASHNAEHWLAHGADYVLRGEGERTFPALLDALSAGEIEPAESSECPRYDASIDPYSEAYFDALGGRIAYLETSRGCPFHCSFCLSAGENVRYFPIDTVKEQINKLSKSGTRTIKLVDRTFNCNSERAYELFEHIIGLDTDCCFHFEVAADLFDERTLSLLGSAEPGRIQLEIGLQSFFEPALRATFRQTDIEKAERNIRVLLQNKNIHIHVDLIAGLPHETLADFRQSFNRAYALGAHMLQLGFLKLLHGSALRAQADDLSIRYDAEPPYEITSSPWMSADDLLILKTAENALSHTYNKCRFLSVLEYVMSVSGLDAFMLLRTLGEAVPNHGLHLTDYAVKIFDCFANLPNVDRDKLRDCMVCDWLGMVKGRNMPTFLRRQNNGRKQAIRMAERQLGRKIARGEAEVLLSGKGVYADGEARDPVTRLYRLHSWGSTN